MGANASIEEVEEADESPLFMQQAMGKIQNNVPFKPGQSVPTIDIGKTMLTKDSVVNSVISQFVERSRIGLEKYGTTLDRTDLSLLDWVQHAQEEMMDGILYLEKIKRMIIESKTATETMEEKEMER